MKTDAVAINRVLVPFSPEEALTITQAAKRAGKSISTIRNWCEQCDIGRRVGGGTWSVSKVALAMYLDGDLMALAVYALGERTTPEVATYFEREGLRHLLARWAQNAQTSQRSQTSQPLRSQHDGRSVTVAP